MATSFIRDSPYLSKDRITDLAHAELTVCSLCNGLLWLPVACEKCETSFCTSCIKTWRIEAEDPRLCPKCSTEYIQRPCPGAITHVLSTFNIICHHKPHGCSAIVPYKSLETHEETCNYRQKTCPGCEEKIIRMHFNAHYYTCPSVLLTCPECNSIYQRQNADQHTDYKCLRVQLNQLQDQMIRIEQIQNGKLNLLESQIRHLIETIEQIVNRQKISIN
ncbi:unnamed protein product [Adineta steineri]|uniref:Uncharacterized protein n=1 Tax=Adineta steineri TaxID=433720 RepID=A0A819ZC80_9BILA|nr:unnamed protein product [Adineta steineri]